MRPYPRVDRARHQIQRATVVAAPAPCPTQPPALEALARVGLAAIARAAQATRTDYRLEA